MGTHEKWSKQGRDNVGGRRSGPLWPENRPQCYIKEEKWEKMT